MKKTLFLVIIILTISLSLQSEGIVLQDIVNPSNITLDAKQIYITQDTDVFIFNRKTGELIKKFGKQGEGPGEFRKSPAPWIPSLTMYITADNRLMINSMGKVSFFSSEGKFISEKKITGRIGRFLPLGKNYIAIGIERDNNKRVISANLMGSDFKKIKRVFSTLWPAQTGKKRNPVIMSQIGTLFEKYSCKDKIALPDEKGGFYVFDSEGKKLAAINPKYNIIKPDPAFKNSLDKFFSEDHRYKRPYTADKNRGLIELPSKLPEYRDYRIADNKIYIISNYRKNDKYEVFVYSIEGKLIKRTFIPLIEKDLLNVFPFAISDGKLFQVVTDDDEEECKLKISNI